MFIHWNKKTEVTWRILLPSSEMYKAGLSYPIKIKRRIPAHCIRRAAAQFVIGKENKASDNKLEEKITLK